MNGTIQIDLSPGRAIGTIVRELNDLLKTEGIASDELFSDQTAWDPKKSKVMPARWYWIACYPVRGNSEGYYVHIDVIHGNDQRTLIALTKVWDWDKACQLANGAARILCEV